VDADGIDGANGAVSDRFRFWCGVALVVVSAALLILPMLTVFAPIVAKMIAGRFVVIKLDTRGGQELAALAMGLWEGFGWRAVAENQIRTPHRHCASPLPWRRAFLIGCGRRRNRRSDFGSYAKLRDVITSVSLSNTASAGEDSAPVGIIFRGPSCSATIIAL